MLEAIQSRKSSPGLRQWPSLIRTESQDSCSSAAKQLVCINAVSGCLWVQMLPPRCLMALLPPPLFFSFLFFSSLFFASLFFPSNNFAGRTFDRLGCGACLEQSSGMPEAARCRLWWHWPAAHCRTCAGRSRPPPVPPHGPLAPAPQRYIWKELIVKNILYRTMDLEQ